MSVLLLPRLTALGVAHVLDAAESAPLAPGVAKSALNDRSAMLSYAASGGNRADDFPERIGAAIRGIAGRSGFPDDSNQAARSKFDRLAAIYLASQKELATGESLRDDVWAYMAIVVVPDVVSWRFPDRAVHRFEGGVRNTLQRLWTRGTVLDRGEQSQDRWELILSLTEDAAVQIFERASVGSNQGLAVALAEGWVKMAAKIGRNKMEPVMRRAIKLVRLRNEVVDLAGLPKPELDARVMQAFEQAEKSTRT